MDNCVELIEVFLEADIETFSEEGVDKYYVLMVLTMLLHNITSKVQAR